MTLKHEHHWQNKKMIIYNRIINKAVICKATNVNTQWVRSTAASINPRCCSEQITSDAYVAALAKDDAHTSARDATSSSATPPPRL